MMSKAVLLSRLRADFIAKKYFSTSAVRRAGHGVPLFSYRFTVPPCDYGPRIQLRTWLQAFVYSWIFYHFWYNPEILFGHPLYSVPNPSLWTDEELGIPPDDYDEIV